MIEKVTWKSKDQEIVEDQGGKAHSTLLGGRDGAGGGGRVNQESRAAWVIQNKGFILGSRSYSIVGSEEMRG
jgi:hypothetical protein